MKIICLKTGKYGSMVTTLILLNATSGTIENAKFCFDNLTGKALALFNKKLSSHAAVSKRYLQEYQKHFEDSSNSDSESDSQPIKKLVSYWILKSKLQL